LRIKLATSGAVATMLVSACGGIESTAEDEVASLLRDPESARFENLETKEVEGVRVVCGEVNGKNGFGGYSEPSNFYYIEDREVGIAEPGKSTNRRWREVCLNDTLPTGMAY